MNSGDWTWSERKNDLNRQKHLLSFSTAVAVFTDPYHRSFPDPFPSEDRWQTYGMVQGILIVVVHTEPMLQCSELIAPGRIISARKATKRERRAYEENSHD